MKKVFSNPREIARDFGIHVPGLAGRRINASVWFAGFLGATLIAIASLVMLIGTIIDGAFGYVATNYRTEFSGLGTQGKALRDMDKSELIKLLYAQSQVFAEDSDKGISGKRLDALAYDKALEDRSVDELAGIIESEILQPQILKTWKLGESIFSKKEILAWQPEESVPFHLEFRSWISKELLMDSQSPDALSTGVRTAFLGSLWIIVLTLLFAFPIGLGAAIFLEEFVDPKNWLARLIQLNIYNLAGVPSIIYGILGLAVFVRSLEGLTQGRSIMAASMTLALLVLPIIIINSQEAIRAVPKSLRDSSMGLGASKLQTMWHHVLPAAMERILTGTILAISRALGETAPLVVVGAATFLQEDPSSIFSGFTALPIQIYQWTARPQEEFRNVAAAAIIILMVLLFLLNGSAIFMRNRISRQRRNMQ